MPIPATTHLRHSLITFACRSELVRNLKDDRRMKSWEKAGKPVPPPHAVKRRIVSYYASAFGVDTFVETGTYFGDMVYAVKDLFQNVISIELSEDLWKLATNRFRGYPHVRIQRGDSGEVLPYVLSSVSGPCLFWLDGHYSSGITAKASSETPVMNEVEAVFEHKIKGHVILIDDARCFDGTHDYPTLDGLRQLVASSRPDYAFSVSNDVIRIHPRREVQCEF
jgi:hypothetical protein